MNAFGVPGHQLRQGHVQHLAPNLVNEAPLFGKVNEVVRTQNAQMGVAPAHQCFGTAQPGPANHRLRLEIRNQLAALKRITQIILQRQKVPGPLVEQRREQANPSAARLFGLVHGQVGIAHQLVASVTMPRVHRHTNAGVKVQAVAL